MNIMQLAAELEDRLRTLLSPFGWVVAAEVVPAYAGQPGGLLRHHWNIEFRLRLRIRADGHPLNGQELGYLHLLAWEVIYYRRRRDSQDLVHEIARRAMLDSLQVFGQVLPAAPLTPPVAAPAVPADPADFVPPVITS